MGAITAISWCDATFNGWWGCVEVSPGCAHCYAKTFANRKEPTRKLWGPNSERRLFGDRHWREPERWNRKAAKEGRSWRVFSGSMCDVFEDHPHIRAERRRLWDLISRTPRLDWLLLTKRADQIQRHLPKGFPAGFGNVWLGVSVESEAHAYRIDHLRQIPAVVRFVSYEPALGPLETGSIRGIDWTIYGGESGPGFRPDKPEWARDIMGACVLHGSAFWFKQRASLRPGSGKLDGELPRAFPMRKWDRLPVADLDRHLEMAKAEMMAHTPEAEAPAEPELFS